MQRIAQRRKTSRRICRAFTMVLSLCNWQRTLHFATRRQCSFVRLRRENLLSLAGQRVTTIVRMCFIVSGDVVDLPEEIGAANKRSSCYCDERRQSEFVVNRALSLYCRRAVFSKSVIQSSSLRFLPKLKP